MQHFEINQQPEALQFALVVSEKVNRYVYRKLR